MQSKRKSWFNFRSRRVALPLRRSLFPAAAENACEIHHDVTNRVSPAAPCSALGGTSFILRLAI